jgi:hypothetical protein
VTPVICEVCRQALMCVEDVEVEGLILELHLRTEHAAVLPWACATCFYVPPGVEGVRCTDIRDGVSCMMYKPRPAWLRL